MPKIWNKYSQIRNMGASVPISTFMCLWANYIFPRWVCLFCWRKYVDRSWKYINRSQTYECGNWGWGPAIPRKGIYKSNCRCSAAHFWYLKGWLWLNFCHQKPYFKLYMAGKSWGLELARLDYRQPVWPAATPAADQLPGLRAPPEDAYRTLERLSPMPPGRKVIIVLSPDF